jgi:hypothetical protein
MELSLYHVYMPCGQTEDIAVFQLGFATSALIISSEVGSETARFQIRSSSGVDAVVK